MDKMSGMAIPADTRLVVSSFGSWVDVWLQKHGRLKKIYIVGDLPSSCKDARCTPLPLEVTADNFAELLLQDPLYLAEGKVAFYFPDDFWVANEPLCQSLVETLLEVTRQVASVYILRAVRGWHMLANSLLNLPRILHESSLSELAGTLRGQRAILVGPGTSLGGSLADLRALSGKITIIALEGALPRLLKAGVVPNLAVSIDDSDAVWRHFAGAADKKIPVVCLLSSGWPLLRYWPGRLFVGRSDRSAERVIEKRLGREWPFLDTGLSPNYAAVELAALMEAASVILVGFDPPPADEANDAETSQNLYLKELEKRLISLGCPVLNANSDRVEIGGAGRCSLQLLPALAGPVWQPPLSRPPAEQTTAAWASCKSHWLKETAKLLTQIDEIQEDTAAALKASETMPFSFMEGETADLLSLGEAPSLTAALRLAWDDWGGHGFPDKELLLLASLYLQYKRDIVRLVQKILTLPSQRSWDPESPINVIYLYENAETQPSPVEAWKDSFLTSLRESDRFQLVVATARFGNLIDVWELMIEAQAQVLLTIDGALPPTTWGLAGIFCLDLKTRPPDEAVLPDYWLPGYIAVCSDPKLKARWHQVLPSDVPLISTVDEFLESYHNTQRKVLSRILE